MKRLSGILLVMVAALAVWVGWMAMRDDPSSAVLIRNAKAKLDASGAVDVFLTIDNSGGPDWLLRVDSPDAHQTTIEPETRAYAIPARSAPSFSEDGAFIRLSGVGGTLEDGQLLPITLYFERAGQISTRVRLDLPKADDSMSGHTMHNGHDMQNGHNMKSGNGMMMDMTPIDLDADGDLPSLALTVEPENDGFEVRVQLENFFFSEEEVDEPHRPGVGHGHLYVGDLKIQRLFDQVATVGALPAGTHAIRVNLNSNDHRVLRVEGEPIQAIVEVTAE